jgi:hypothetical protein
MIHETSTQVDTFQKFQRMQSMSGNRIHKIN